MTTSREVELLQDRLCLQLTSLPVQTYFQCGVYHSFRQVLKELAEARALGQLTSQLDDLPHRQ